MKALRAYKATPAYQAQLHETIRKASLEASHGATDIQRRRARLTLLEAETEFNALSTGADPDVFSGLIHFQQPERDLVF